jgi:glycosyltransferase involved in cell wall biosynthesis
MGMTKRATEGGPSDRLDLAVVMPVYNEEGCIADVVGSWLKVFSKQNIKFRVIVLNDGSTDGTKDVLAKFAGNPNVEIVDKANSGHGPTILVGYSKAVGLAEWVFQCDSDDEISPGYFPDLWNRRNDFDALLGYRSLSNLQMPRIMISVVSRIVVRLLFGRGVRDVNIPYRLIRSDLLGQIVEQIPPGVFAPNVIISGALSQAKLRIHNQHVKWEYRKTGTVSIARWKLWKSAIDSFWQTLKCRPRIRS